MEGELDSLQSSVLSLLNGAPPAATPRSQDDSGNQPGNYNNGNDVITQVAEIKDIAQEIQTHAFVATDVLNDLLK